jgi:hypothetical protein
MKTRKKRKLNQQSKKEPWGKASRRAIGGKGNEERGKILSWGQH